MKKIPENFTCECGTVHEFGFYVAAHSDIKLVHTCPECQAQHWVKNYNVWLKKRGTNPSQRPDKAKATG